MFSSMSAVHEICTVHWWGISKLFVFKDETYTTDLQIKSPLNSRIILQLEQDNCVR